MLDIMLFLGAVLGHCALTVRSHNWWYGSPLGRRPIDVLQFLHGLVFLNGPIVFWLVCRFDLLSLFDDSARMDRLLLGGYVAICWVVGFVAFPAITLRRLVRRCPAIVSEQSRILYLTQELGHPPAGDGKHRWMALLPLNEVLQVELTERTLGIPNLPVEWDGLRVLHLSDLHLCGTPGREYYARAIELCRAWQPDLIALTGDYVDSVAHHEWVAPLLGSLTAPAGVLAILGNHDLWYEPDRLRLRLRELGFRVLSHQWEQIEVRGRPLIVVGNEGPWIKPAPDLANAPPDVFRLCLSHTPDNMAWAQRQRIGLMLSGHVHGGQVRLPLIGSILVPSQYGRRYDCGVFQVGQTVLHVSRGLGGEHPLRFRCRPEVTLLVLRRAQTEGEA